MNFRKYAEPRIFGFMIAPMVDILLVVLVFFIVTWNFALSENELDVRVPTATKANEPQPYVGQVVINITAKGAVIVNRQQESAGTPGTTKKTFPALSRPGRHRARRSGCRLQTYCRCARYLPAGGRLERCVRDGQT